MHFFRLNQVNGRTIYESKIVGAWKLKDTLSWSLEGELVEPLLNYGYFSLSENSIDTYVINDPKSNSDALSLSKFKIDLDSFETFYFGRPYSMIAKICELDFLKNLEYL